MTDRDILEKHIYCRLEEYKDSGKFIYPTEVFKNALLAELRAYYREKIKQLLPKKKECKLDYTKAIGDDELEDAYDEMSTVGGFNQAIDAILKEIDKEIR